MKKLNKTHRICLYLLLFALLLFVLWLTLDMPRFSAESAFRRVEQRELAQKSEILRVIENPPWHTTSGKWDVFLVIGKTDSALQMTEVRRQGLRWNSPESMRTVSMEKGCFGLIPWEMWTSDKMQFTYGAVLYTGKTGSTGRLILTVGEGEFSAPFRTEEDGLAVVVFDGLADEQYGEHKEQIEQYLWGDLNRTMPISLRAEFDVGGGRVEVIEHAAPVKE